MSLQLNHQSSCIFQPFSQVDEDQLKNKIRAFNTSSEGHFSTMSRLIKKPASVVTRSVALPERSFDVSYPYLDNYIKMEEKRETYAPAPPRLRSK